MAGAAVITAHDIIGSYFIGPKAENLPYFREHLTSILDKLERARLDYQPQDAEFIDKNIRESDPMKNIRAKFNEALVKAAELLGKHSIPFWHPRYQGHMCTDLTMPGLLGYIMTMIYNPNNVTVEASPFTTVAELKAGQQLCELFGYSTDATKKDVPTAWGHITCDGTVANLESIWVARNLKFYPLSLYMAMKDDLLWFIGDHFRVTTAVGEEKLFRDLSVWELLNLPPKVILGMADTLYREFAITNKCLEEVLTKYNIQTIGKDVLERRFNIQKPGKYFHAKSRHYSWPKGGAIAGLGSGNMHGIELDVDGHIDIEDLERELNRCLEEQQPVYAVVAIMGSTEEGAADRLSSIIDLRKKFRARGLTFLVHADAAWGGYFATMVPRDVMREPYWKGGGKRAVEAIPSLALREDTLTDFLALKEADSITVDPHKAGYIPYPAGALTYRDGRMRFLVTWTSPYLTQGSLQSIGVYGVEGSKPGAAAMATWLSNKTIGLNPTGYGRLLGEAAFTSARLSAYYAAMHLGEVEQVEVGEKTMWKETTRKNFICIPFNRLPDEKEGKGSLSDEVNDWRKRITDGIIEKDNDVICQDADMMGKMRQLGSDLNINAFALNWRREDGSLNDEIEEANYLMRRVVNRLSVTSADQDPREIPLYLTSTQFTPELYGKCSQHFMKRLGLKPAPQDLWVLRNVVMSPFPTEKNFIKELMAHFETVINEEVQKGCWKRNKANDYKLRFLLRGTDQLFLEFETCFHRGTQRQQIIFSANLDKTAMDKYVCFKKNDSCADFILETKKQVNLEKLVQLVLDTEELGSHKTDLESWKNDLESWKNDLESGKEFPELNKKLLKLNKKLLESNKTLLESNKTLTDIGKRLLGANKTLLESNQTLADIDKRILGANQTIVAPSKEDPVVTKLLTSEETLQKLNKRLLDPKEDLVHLNKEHLDLNKELLDSIKEDLRVNKELLPLTMTGRTLDSTIIFKPKCEFGKSGCEFVDDQGNVVGIDRKDDVIAGTVGQISCKTHTSISCKVTVASVVKSRPLNSANRELQYPRHYLPFYLYGTKEQKHISHMLLRAPNATLSAHDVKLDSKLSSVVDEHLVEGDLPQGLILTLTDFREATMQPFPATNAEVDDTTFFFRQGREYSVKVYRDPKPASADGPGLLEFLGSPIGQGTMELGEDVHVDVQGPNIDPFDNPPKPMEPWEDDLNEIGDVLNGAQPSTASKDPRASSQLADSSDSATSSSEPDSRESSPTSRETTPSSGINDHQGEGNDKDPK